MPRYFFHQIHKGARIEDFDGVELSDIAEARAEASAGAIEIMADRLWQGKDPDHSKFEICDEQGKALMVVHFSEVLGSLAKEESTEH